MKRYLTFGALALFLGSAHAAMAALPAALPDIVAECESCHGAKGNSPAASVPQLNGLSADYLFLRLKKLSDPSGQSQHAVAIMWPIVARMNDDSKRLIANYFARQAPPYVKLFGAVSGETLYVKGLPAEGLAACATCHGANAEGKGSAPRLAGQSSDYLKTQLWAFNFATRVHGAMNGGATRLTSERINALATFLAGR